MARITIEDCLKAIPNRFQLTLAATYRAAEVRDNFDAKRQQRQEIRRGNK